MEAKNEMTSYERSYRQFEIFCTRKDLDPTEVKNLEAFKQACLEGYPNNKVKTEKCVRAKELGILKTMETKGYIKSSKQTTKKVLN